MSILDTIKPFWPILITFVLPRAWEYYNALKTSVRTRPPPRPLPPKASRSLNVLFGAVCVFLYLSFNIRAYSDSNIFATTQTRLNVPSELLFTRLALLRPNGLTELDEALQSKLTSQAKRLIYLRYGPDTLLGCPFCHPEDTLTYTLHALPTQILAPHLLHFAFLGIATSRSISGSIASAFRHRVLMAAIGVFALDIYLNAVSDFTIDASKPSPPSLYAITAIVRPLSLCLFDVGLAFLIYATATHRFIFFPFLASAADGSDDPQELFQQTQRLLNETNTTLQMAQMKLRGVNVVQSTVGRSEPLDTVKARYWRQVRQAEGGSAWEEEIDEEILQDEEVQAAMNRVLAGTLGGARARAGVDAAALRTDATTFIREVTRSLDSDQG